LDKVYFLAVVILNDYSARILLFSGITRWLLLQLSNASEKKNHILCLRQLID